MATAEELAHAFARVAESEPDLPADLGERLSAVCAEVRAALPGIALDELALAEALARIAPTGASFQTCHPTDLALAGLAARGDGDAIAEIERQHGPTIGFACHRFASRDQSVDDLRQILRTVLYVAEPGARPKIAEFSGRGSLANWLRILAVRTFIDVIRRKDRAREALVTDDVPEPLAAGDLALDAIKSEHRAVVAGALRDAIRELPAGTRHLLRQHLVLGVSIDQVGAALGLHRATAARRIARARDELVQITRRLVAERLAIPHHELDEVCGLVVSGIDVSMRALLATSRPAEVT